VALFEILYFCFYFGNTFSEKLNKMKKLNKNIKNNGQKGYTFYSFFGHKSFITEENLKNPWNKKINWLKLKKKTKKKNAKYETLNINCFIMRHFCFNIKNKLM